MHVIDTSFLVSFYLPADENNPKALEMLERMASEQLVIPEYILYETLTVLNYKAGIELCKSAHEELANNSQVDIYHFDKHEQKEIIDLFFKLKKISVADASVVYLAEKLGCGVIAFDLQLHGLAKK